MLQFQNENRNHANSKEGIANVTHSHQNEFRFTISCMARKYGEPPKTIAALGLP
jgi:hypothetical protein